VTTSFALNLSSVLRLQIQRYFLESLSRVTEATATADERWDYTFCG
jgi:predicted DNA-binding ribbon-helix-helix protein